MSVLSKLIYSFNPNPIKIPAKVPIDIDKISLIFIWKGKGTRRTEIVFFFFEIVFINNKIEAISLHSFKTYCIDTVMKAAWHL